MKRLYLFILTISIALLCQNTSLAGGGGSGTTVPPPPGMPSCAGQDIPGEAACNATPICNLNGYCETTSSSWAVDTWSQLTGAFCGSIENNAFLSFTADSTAISFDAYVYNCLDNEGIQVFVFEAANCGSGPVNGLTCVNEMWAQNTPYDISATGLTPGNKYYIMIDGFGGDVCDYTFVANSGVATPVASTGNGIQVKNDNYTICKGQSATINASGGSGNYTWSGDPGLSSTTGTPVTITPPATVGVYNYHISSSGTVAGCPSSQDYDFTITVKDTCSCTPPSLTINNLNICSGKTVDLNNAIDGASDPATKTYYSSQNDANTSNNPIAGGIVSSDGVYWVRAEDPSQSTCFRVYPITIGKKTLSYTSTITDATCGSSNGAIDLVASGGGGAPPSYTYTIDDGTNPPQSNTTGSFSPFPAGPYTITIKGLEGCEITDLVTINNTGAPYLDQVVLSPPSCHKKCDAGLIIGITGGNTPYTINITDSVGGNITTINNNMGSLNLNNLCSGKIAIEVTDATGCIAIVDTLINDVPLIDASFDFKDFCVGMTNGPENVVTPNGTWAFNPSPSDGAQINKFNGSISYGEIGTTYTVEYTTPGTCNNTSTQKVQVNGVKINASHTDEICGKGNGNISVNIQGATPYYYEFVNNVSGHTRQGITSQTIAAVPDLSAGHYNIYITDANGCSADTTITVKGESPPIIIAPNDTSICLGETVTFSAYNPNGASIVWNHSYVNGSPLTPSSVGKDTLIVTGTSASGCIVKDSVVVTIKGNPSVNAIQDYFDICFRDSITLEADNPDSAVITWDHGVVDGQQYMPTAVDTTKYYVTATASNGCTAMDSATVIVRDIPDIFAGKDFGICYEDSIALTAQNPDNADISWDKGVIDGKKFRPTPPGDTVTYIVTATFNKPDNKCSSMDSIDVIIHKLPLPYFKASTLKGCEPLTVKFTDTSKYSNIIDCTWIFGDGMVSDSCDSVVHTFQKKGLYDVSLILTDDFGCIDTTRKDKYIEVLSSPTASFIANPTYTTTEETEVHFTNQSQNAVDYVWEFGDNSVHEFGFNAIHTYPDLEPGQYTVTLLVTDAKGCSDLAQQVITIVYPDLDYEIPNVFTPNGDGINDYFKFVYHHAVKKAQTVIINRWGNQVFESNKVEFKWNGSVNNSGAECTGGTYFYVITLTDLMGKKYKENGYIQLARD